MYSPTGPACNINSHMSASEHRSSKFPWLRSLSIDKFSFKGIERTKYTVASWFLSSCGRDMVVVGEDVEEEGRDEERRRRRQVVSRDGL